MNFPERAFRNGYAALVRVLTWAYLAAAAFGCTPRSPSCVEVQADRWEAVFGLCSAEYAASSDPVVGFHAARAAYYLGDHGEVARIAGPLTSGPSAADAEFLLGSSALARADLGSAVLARAELETARVHLERALSMHGAAGQIVQQTRDAYQLGGVWVALGEYRMALDAMEILREAALGARDHRMQVYADVGSANIYRAIGDRSLAEEAIERAVANAQHADDRLYARFKQGTVLLDAGYQATARRVFERVLADGDPSSSHHAQFLRAAQLNLAYIDRKQGRPADALQRIEAQRSELDEMTFRLNRGTVLADLGRLEEAREELRLAEAAGPEGEWAWWVPYQAALVETAAGRTDAAIAACGRAIAKVTELAARSGTYGPKVIAKHRQPHFHLIGLYAARRQWKQVLEVVATLDAQALLDSREAPTDLVEPDPALVLPGPARGELGDASTVVDAWRGRRLVIVVPGGERAWRIVLADGVVEGRDLGEVRVLEELARTLADHPADAAAGRALGEALLAGLPAPATHDLLVVGPLAGASLASLRLGDRLALSVLRIARVPGVLPRIAGAPGPAGIAAPAGVAGAPERAVVLGDPQGDLPASAAETSRIAARLRTPARVGPAATRAALAGASGADLLHISAHTRIDFDGAALMLADGAVAPVEIARLARGPRRVVLASCGASAGTDDMGGGSLAHAFLDAGAEHVVATKWTIEDGDAARLVAAFYDAGGDRDPIRGLEAAQRRLAGTLTARTWASFEVFAARPALR
jgi:tetratricopeptide (TPR) repeat protein